MRAVKRVHPLPKALMGRVGAIYALILLGLKKYWLGLPFILIGIPAILAGLLAFAVPETTGCKLPESVDEALELGKNYKFHPWCGRNKSKA